MACLRIAAIERKSKKHSPNDGSKPKQRSYGIKREKIYSILVIPVIIQRKQKIHYKTTYTEREFYTLPHQIDLHKSLYNQLNSPKIKLVFVWIISFLFFVALASSS